MIAYTIVSRAYVPHARVLARSYSAHHGGSKLIALLIDDVAEEVDPANEPFDVLRLTDLDVGLAEIHQMAMQFGDKLIAAIKPWIFEHFLTRGADFVLYLDGDCVVYDSLEYLAELARAREVMVVPHVITPVPQDGLLPDDTTILSVGIYNAGMFGVGSAGQEFVRFLQERLRIECRTDISAMRVNEQRWLDFVPALFDHVVCRDPGMDVAPWNIHERHLTVHQGRFLVNAEPLRTFHFSGFDPRTSSILSARDYWHNPRIAVEEMPALEQLVDQYRKDLLGSGFDESKDIPFAFDFLADGSPILSSLRFLYGSQLREAESTGHGSVPPDPFDPQQAPAFTSWAKEAYKRHHLHPPALLNDGEAGNLAGFADISGRMNPGDAGRRNGVGIIEAQGSAGFVAFGPRAQLTDGDYLLVLDIGTRLDEALALDASVHNLTMDISLDGYVLACADVTPRGQGLQKIAFSVPEPLGWLSLRAGVDVRLFSHGNSHAVLHGALLSAPLIDQAPEAPEAPEAVNWLLEMSTGGVSHRVARQIHQDRGARGFVAMGPHWRLMAGRYRATLTLGGWVDEQVDGGTAVAFLEALVDGDIVGVRTILQKDLELGSTSLEFDTHEDQADIRTEFRVRGSKGAEVILDSLHVQRLGDARKREPTPVDWLPAMWPGDDGVRVGTAIELEPNAPGILAYGPHWSLRPGRYSATVNASCSPTVQTEEGMTLDAGLIEVVVGGMTEVSAPLRCSPNGQGHPNALDFQILDRDLPQRTVEIRVVASGIIPIALHSVFVVASSDVH